VAVREKQAWAMLVIAVAGLGIYLALLLASRDGGPIEDVHYQPLMIGTILAAIVAGIVVSIIISIQANLAGDSDRPDERDQAIARFGTNVSQAFLVIGGLSGLLMAMAEWDWFWIANVIYLGFALAGILEGVAKVVTYRRGLPW
jgi:MFS family permease